MKKNKRKKNKDIHTKKNSFPNSVFRQNMWALRKNYPELAKLMESTKINQNYKVVNVKSDTPPTLVSTAMDFCYYDPDDPIKDVENQLISLNLKNTRLAIFLGFGLGYEVEYYLKNMAQKQNTIYALIIEKEPEIFRAALETSNIVHLIENKKIKFVVGVKEEELYLEFSNYLRDGDKHMFLKALNAVYHISALQLNKEYYLKAFKIFRESGIQQLQRYGNSPEDSLIGIKNMLYNINEIICNPGINLLYDKFKGRPAVIVSTGPSLNKNKHLLKGLEDKALIIAADASLKILLKIGVKPHLVTSLERDTAVMKLVDGLQKEDVKDIYFAACPVIEPIVYEAYPGPRIIVYRNFDHFKWLGIDRGILDIKLSAGNMAFKVAEALGCDPIILIGQDLAFSRDGHTHADGMVYGEKQENYYKSVLEVAGNDGEPILTSPVWYGFLKAYELDLAGYTGTCINSTEGGAYIYGTQVMDFKDAISNYVGETFHPLEILHNHLKLFSIDVIKENKQQVLELIDKTVSDLQSIISICREGLGSYQKHKAVLKSILNNPVKGNEIGEIINGLEKEILSHKSNISKNYVQTYQLFLMHVLQSYVIKFEMDMVEIPGKYDDQSLAIAQILLRHAEWYETVKGLVEICLNYILKCKQKIGNAGVLYA